MGEEVKHNSEEAASEEDEPSTTDSISIKSKSIKETKNSKKKQSEDGDSSESNTKSKGEIEAKRYLTVTLENIAEKGKHEVLKKKIPLLDQPVVIEGSRTRRKLVVIERKNSLSKRFSVEIPNGGGRALGRIPSVITGIKRLDDVMVKQLHRALFDKGIGKRRILLQNIMQFRGFNFEKNSEEYKTKLNRLREKLDVAEMKSLLCAFDLNKKCKTKDESVQCILDFLIHPVPSKTPKKTSLISHPKRKATKRNYFEPNLDYKISRKKRRKTKKSATKETEDEEPKINGSEKKEDETTKETDNESKKPAKKRKRNQVVDDSEEEESLASIKAKAEAAKLNLKKKRGRSNTFSS